MPSKLNISNNPHIYKRRKHFRRRQSGNARLQSKEQKDEQTLMNDSLTIDLYSQYALELIQKEKAVKQAQIALLKIASSENEQEESNTSWSDFIGVQKHRINFLKQLGNYMEECEGKLKRIQLDDIQLEDGPSIYKLNLSDNIKTTGMSINFIGKKHNSSPKKLETYEKKWYGEDYFKQDTCQKDISDKCQQVDITKSKTYLSQCSNIIINPSLLNCEQTLINHRLSSAKQMRQYNHKEKRTQSIDQSSFSNAYLDQESDSKNCGKCLFCRFSIHKRDYTSSASQQKEQESDQKRGMPHESCLQKYSNQNENNYSICQNQRRRSSLTGQNIQQQPNNCVNSNLKQNSNIIKIKPFFISMLQTSTLVQNTNELQLEKQQSSSSCISHIQQQSNQNQANQNRNQYIQNYLNTNQSEDTSAHKQPISKYIQYNQQINEDNNNNNNNNSINNNNNINNSISRRLFLYCLDENKKRERPRTSNAKNPLSNRDKILTIINNNEHQEQPNTCLIKNQFGGIIIKNNNNNWRNISQQGREKAKENSYSELFINKGVFQGKNKQKIQLHHQKGGLNQCNSTRDGGETYVNDAEQQTQRQQKTKRDKYQSQFSSNSNISVTARQTNRRSQLDINQEQLTLTSNLFKNNKAVVIGKARNQLNNPNYSKNILNNSAFSTNPNPNANQSYINHHLNYQSYHLNHHYNHNINNPNNMNNLNISTKINNFTKNNNSQDIQNQQHSLLNQHLYIERNNFIANQLLSSDTKNSSNKQNNKY